MKTFSIDILRSIILELLVAFLIGSLTSWFIFHRDPLPKQVVCKDYINQNLRLSKQIEEIQISFNLQKADLIKIIKIKEAKLCLDRIEKYKAVCETLRCEICKRVK